LRAEPITLILDTDPALGVVEAGVPRDIDDGLVIIECLNDPGIDLRAVTTVAGNASQPATYRVAQELLNMKSSSVPLALGAHQAEAWEVSDAVQLLHQTLSAAPATVLAIGPLTNIAALLHHHPDLQSQIQEVVVVMGRSPGVRFYIGGHGPVRDFNYAFDPEAAKRVIESGVPMRFVPFEVSKQVVVTREDLDEIRERETSSAQYLHENAQRWVDFWTTHFPGERGFHPWDSVALAAVRHPEWFVWSERGVQFAVASESAHGVGQSETGKVIASQPQLELSDSFTGARHAFATGFVEGGMQHMLDNLIQYVF